MAMKRWLHNETIASFSDAVSNHTVDSNFFRFVDVFQVQPIGLSVIYDGGLMNLQPDTLL